MKPILPGSTIGVLGGGQLGRMLASAAHRLGYHVSVFDPEANSPAGQVADRHVCAPFADDEALADFARGVDVVTIEFENVPVATLQALSQTGPVCPGPDILHVTQNRLREKRFLRAHDFPVAQFESVCTDEELNRIPPEFLPGVLKTAEDGYDGRGQRFVSSPAELAQAWEQLGRTSCVLEVLVDFSCEFSVIVARNGQQTAHYEPILNAHRNHVLDISQSPSLLPLDVCENATEIARGIAEQFDYVGLMCVEFFLGRDGQILINEIAPRPHNSGHLTIEAHATSQFEQQLRAVCGLPLGSTTQHRPAAMANLLGDLWENEVPHWGRALSAADAYLHLYGKETPRAGRKMGHLTCLADTAGDAATNARDLRHALSPSSPQGDNRQPHALA